MANSVDPDETPHSAASHLGLNCLLRPVCPNTYGNYGISVTIIIIFATMTRKVHVLRGMDILLDFLSIFKREITFLTSSLLSCYLRAFFKRSTVQ